MPYKNKELAKEYRKRTQGPYMKKYRAENKEKFTEYYREWSRKRYANEEKRKMDYEKSKTAPSFKKIREWNKNHQKKICDELTDTYIKKNLTKRHGLTIEAIDANPEIIEIHRLQLLTKRILKNKKHDNINHLQC